MTLHWACPTELHAGAGIWDSARRSWNEQVFVVADARLGPPTTGISATRWEPDAGTLDDAAALAVLIADAAPRTVVGIGGGSVLDQVKLAALMCAEPRMLDVLEVRASRAGLVQVPPVPRRDFRLVLVPSTLGTGVEVSGVACVVHEGSRRLVVGHPLRADKALIDPVVTATLPLHLQVEGVLEALLRVAGPFIGSPSRGGGLADAQSKLLIRSLIEAGDRLVTEGSSAELRLECSLLSATSHTGLALAGLERYSATHWFVANEMASVLSVRKMQATAAVLPAMWERVLVGDERYGRVDQLRRLGSWIGDGDPVDGLRALLARWGVRPDIEITEARSTEIARRCIAAWGGRLPMLAGLGVTDLASVLQRVDVTEPDCA